MGKARGSSFQAIEAASAWAPGLRKVSGLRGCCVMTEAGNSVTLSQRVSKIQIMDEAVGMARNLDFILRSQGAIMHLTWHAQCGTSNTERQEWKQGDERMKAFSWSREKTMMTGALGLTWSWREVHGFEKHSEGRISMMWWTISCQRWEKWKKHF